MVTRQVRASGGLWLQLGGIRRLVDPGPGSLVRCLSSRPRLDPAGFHAILLSHRHIDHANDVNILAEAMTEGGRVRRGTLFCPADALEGDPVVLRYVRGYVGEVVTLRPGGRYAVRAGDEGVVFETPLALRHSVETYGFLFYLPFGRLALVSDTTYFPELARHYAAEVMVVNVGLLDPSAGGPPHLSLAGAEALLAEARPRTAILTHFGMKLLRARPWELAREMSRRLGLAVLAARDGMTVDLREAAAGLPAAGAAGAANAADDPPCEPAFGELS